MEKVSIHRIKECDSIYKNNETPKMLINTILMFFVVFSIHFKGMPWHVSPRIIGMLFIIFIFNRRSIFNIAKFRISKTDFIWIISSVFILVYSWFTIVINDAGNSIYTISDSAFNFLIFVCILPLFAVNMFEDASHFCRCILYACVIQSIIVLMSFVFLPVRELLETIQIMDFSRYDWRIIGLGIAGAGGSVYLLCGLIAAGYLIIKGEREVSVFLAICIIFIAIAAVGRTGFYAALLILFYLVLFNSKRIKSKVLTNLKLLTIAGLVIIFGYFFVFYLFDIDMQLFDYTYFRLGELFRDGLNSRTLNSINNINIAVPGLSAETLIGTGITRGITSSGVIFMHDSGYVQRYAALGILVCILSYVSLYVYVIKLLKRVPKMDKLYILYCLLILFVLEYKEPFIYMLAYPFTLIMISKLANRKVRNNRYT